MKTKLFTLFVALLATTSLWAQHFQVGDLYYRKTPVAETAAFKHRWGDEDWLYRLATKTAEATFEINAIYSESADGVTVATDVTGANAKRYRIDQIEFVGDVADGDIVNFKFVSEDLTIGKMTITLIKKGDEPKEEKDITVKAKVPAAWTNTITAWVWATGMDGNEVVPTKEGDWYVFSHYGTDLNIIFKNGVGWNGTANQTVAITVIQENTCFVLESDGYNTATYTHVDCNGSNGSTIDDTPRSVWVTCQSASSDNYAYLSAAHIPATVVYNGKTVEVVGIDKSAFANSPITSITTPNSVTSIGNYAFSNCSSLTSITIPNSVTSIGSYAFEGCIFSKDNFFNKSLLDEKANDYWGARIIGDSEIDGLFIRNDTVIWCRPYVTTAVIPNSVTSIGEGAFRSCYSLTSVTIPNSVTSIGDYAFSDCSSLTSVTIPNSVTSIGSSVFRNCSSLTSVSIPNSVKSIGSSVFRNCSSLTSVTIPNSVTSIGSSAFEGCSSLTSVTIPNSVTSIESSVFRNCSSLTSVTIPNSVTSIGNSVFEYCSSLASITIPNSVTSIGYYAFMGCEKLGTLVLGDKIKEIGNYAFKECNKLYHIYCYAPEPPVIEENVFTNYNVNLYVPCNYLDNYKYDRVFGSFRYIQCIDSEDVTTNDVVVTPGTNDVTITWPTEGNADTYTIVIKKGNEVFCTLTFNADGQLLNIAFAPGRDGNHPVQYAEQAGNGYRFTVTSLESGTKYGYNIDVKDASNKTIKSHSGEFTTQSTTAVENITTNNANIQKIIRDGQFIIVRDGVEYNAVGQEM